MNETLQDLQRKRESVIFDFDMLCDTEEREQTKRTIQALKNDLVEYKQLYEYEVKQNKKLREIATDYQLLYEMEINEQLERQKHDINEKLNTYKEKYKN